MARFTAPGTVTQYEVRQAKSLKTSWREVWRSLNEPKHPHSLEEWLTFTDPFQDETA